MPGLASTKQKEVLSRAWVNTINALQSKKWHNVAELKKILSDIGPTIKQRLDTIVAMAEAGTIDEVAAIQRLSLLTGEIQRLAHGLGFDITATLEKNLVDIYRDSYYRAAWQIDIATPELISAKFAMLSDDMIRAAISTPFKGGMFSERLFRISNETALDIQADVVRGIITGRPIEDTAAEIYERFGDEGTGYFWRAQLIARTETIRARELARIQLYKDNADLIQVDANGEPLAEWVVMESACDLCEELAERCNEGGETDLEPIEDSHPNCVCTKRAVLKDWSEISGDSPDAESGPVYQPYDEWLEEKGIEMPGEGE